MDFQTNFTYDIDTLNFTINAPTGLSSNIKTNDLINIYPNPTNDVLNIKFLDTEQSSKLQIINSLGQTVKEEEIHFETEKQK